jgi:hypothetical protein
LPQTNALLRHWKTVPPAAVQLKRIALALGIPEPRVQTLARSPQDAFREAIAAGLPVIEGRPDDPMLDLLD